MCIRDSLTGDKKNITVVGDDSQSIYSFRGANFGNIMTFTERYPEAAIFKLEINYRSTKEILDFANASIAHNRRQHKKKLVCANGNRGSLPVLKAFRNVYEQADGITNEIKNLIRNGISYGEIAVLYRSHYHSMELQMELTRHNIPFTIHSGLKFFELAHIKTLTAFLKAFENLQDFVSWKRLLSICQGIGPKTAGKLTEKISKLKNISELNAKELLSIIPAKSHDSFKELLFIFESILKRPSFRPDECIKDIIESPFFNHYLIKNFQNIGERTDDCFQFASFAENFKTLRGLIDELSLVSSGEDYYNGCQGVVLSSIHQAKGLEWPYVFIIWLAEGKFPVYKGININEHLEEERRLFYVATTRAKKKLYLCFPQCDTRNKHGFERWLEPSRFIVEIPPHLYKDINDYY